MGDKTTSFADWLKKRTALLIAIAATVAATSTIITFWEKMGLPYPVLSSDLDSLRSELEVQNSNMERRIDEAVEEVRITIFNEFARKDRMDVIRARLDTLEKALSRLPDDASDERESIMDDIEDLREELEELERQ